MKRLNNDISLVQLFRKLVNCTCKCMSHFRKNKIIKIGYDTHTVANTHDQDRCNIYFSFFLPK